MVLHSSETFLISFLKFPANYLFFSSSITHLVNKMVNNLNNHRDESFQSSSCNIAKSFGFQLNKEELRLLKPSTFPALEPTTEPAPS